MKYHEQVTEVEKLITENNFEDALGLLDQLFETYEFVFKKEYLIAAQLAVYLDQKETGIQYVKAGIEAGWEWKKLRKNKYLTVHLTNPQWKSIKQNYDSLRSSYLTKLDVITRDHVHEMFKKDQWKALGALLRIGDKAQQRYALKKFAPHSEQQMCKLVNILQTKGYPGERLIGNNFWMSTILSHHNSITSEYSKQDTLYNYIRPMLLVAIRKGQISPYEFASIDDWHIDVLYERMRPGYGFLNPPKVATIAQTNQIREDIGLRSVEQRNKLVEIEDQTGMNFYLPNWVKGKIIVEE
jgi:hypothetical protein